MTLGKQGVTMIGRISIRKGEQIQTNTYMLTFNQPHTPLGYYLERVEKYIPASLRYFKCQKYGHHREANRGWLACAKCGEKDPDIMEEDCWREIRCPNCRQDHLAYHRLCDIYEKEKEILEVAQEECVLQEKGEIVRSHTGLKHTPLLYDINVHRPRAISPVAVFPWCDGRKQPKYQALSIRWTVNETNDTTWMDLHVLYFTQSWAQAIDTAANPNWRQTSTV